MCVKQEMEVFNVGIVIMLAKIAFNADVYVKTYRQKSPLLLKGLIMCLVSILYQLCYFPLLQMFTTCNLEIHVILKDYSRLKRTNLLVMVIVSDNAVFIMCLV